MSDLRNYPIMQDIENAAAHMMCNWQGDYDRTGDDGPIVRFLVAYQVMNDAEEAFDTAKHEALNINRPEGLDDESFTLVVTFDVDTLQAKLDDLNKAIRTARELMPAAIEAEQALPHVQSTPQDKPTRSDLLALYATKSMRLFMQFDAMPGEHDTVLGHDEHGDSFTYGLGFDFGSFAGVRIRFPVGTAREEVIRVVQKMLDNLKDEDCEFVATLRPGNGPFEPGDIEQELEQAQAIARDNRQIVEDLLFDADSLPY